MPILSMMAKSRPGYTAGFTLIEVIVVLGIAALVSLLVIPSIGSSLDKLKVRNTAYAIQGDLKLTRQQAMINHREQVFTLNLNSPAYTTTLQSKTLDLPVETRITLLTAESELVTAEAGQIRFFHDGSSTGGMITLAFREERYDISIDWLTGLTEIQR